MGNPGMPMLSRLGNSGLWQSSLRYDYHAQPFFQERSIRDIIDECLLYEYNFRPVWRDMMLFNTQKNKAEFIIMHEYFELLCEHIVVWYPLVEDDIYEIGEDVPVVPLSTTMLKLTDRFYRCDNMFIVDVLFYNPSDNEPEVSKLLSIINDVTSMWSSIIIDLDVIDEDL